MHNKKHLTAFSRKINYQQIYVFNKNSEMVANYINVRTKSYHNDGRCVIVSKVMPACFAAW